MKQVSLLILLCLLFVSCGGGGNNEQAEQALDWYDKVEIGMPVDEAAGVIGFEGQTDNTGADTEYQWKKGESGIAVKIDPETNTIASKRLDLADAHLLKPSLNVISENLRHKIKEGMSYDEVREIIGDDGIQVQSGDWAGLGFELVSYKWFNRDGSYLLVQFDKDIKVLFSNFVKPAQ